MFTLSYSKLSLIYTDFLTALENTRKLKGLHESCLDLLLKPSRNTLPTTLNLHLHFCTHCIKNLKEWTFISATRTIP